MHMKMEHRVYIYINSYTHTMINSKTVYSGSSPLETDNMNLESLFVPVLQRLFMAPRFGYFVRNSLTFIVSQIMLQIQ